jgi:transposase
MSNIKVLGIDLAKNVFQLHGTNEKGKCVKKMRLSRPKLIEFVANLPACEIGIEACGGSHYWARLFKQYGHTVKMMSPQFVKPYVKSNKNDCNDAAAIAEAVRRPDMKYVPIKTIEQQDIQLLHRARELSIKQQTALVNQLRGLLLEYGIVIKQGISQVKHLPQILSEYAEWLTEFAQDIFKQMYEQYKMHDSQVERWNKQIEQLSRGDERCQELMKVEGVGPLTATAMVAAVGNARVFKNGREMAAWLGIVPKQHSSGNKIRLGRISKRGDRYLRTLLIHGARAVVNVCERKTDQRSSWVADKKIRCGRNKAAVALANKNARIMWALLSSGECYRRCAQDVVV